MNPLVKNGICPACNGLITHTLRQCQKRQEESRARAREAKELARNTPKEDGA